MVDRRLILLLEGAPLCWGLTAGDIRKRILEYPEDDVDLLQVWHVPSHGSYEPAGDITQRFARDWAREIENNGAPQLLAAFPAFVREAVGDELQARWAAEMQRAS